MKLSPSSCQECRFYISRGVIDPRKAVQTEWIKICILHMQETDITPAGSKAIPCEAGIKKDELIK